MTDESISAARVDIFFDDIIWRYLWNEKDTGDARFIKNELRN